MEIKEIHIYTTPECNLKCTYCFREYWKNHSEENLIDIANILATSGIEKVVLGGGEPTTVSNITDVLKTLKDAGIYTEMHTNATNLELDKYDSVLDGIAIPIDSLNQDIQKQMKRFDYVPVFRKAVAEIQKHDFDLKYHTVAAYPNIDDIPEIYDFIKETDFSAWRIYLFNHFQAIDSFLQRNNSVNLEFLEGPTNYKTGCTDSLFAKFLLLEEQMQKHNDKHIQFVDNFEHEKRYVFINSAGDATTSQTKVKIGNIIKEGFSGIMENLDNVEDDVCENGVEHVFGSLPAFARLSDYACQMHVEDEELHAIKDEYIDLWHHLAGLYAKRYPNGAPIC